MKKLFILITLCLTVNIFASKVISGDCSQKGDNYIFAGAECIQYFLSEGDTEGVINIIVHGTWDAGTNTLGRYAPFAETLSMSTDITSIAVALPGYSNSSTNNLKSLVHKGTKNQAARKEYITFLGELVMALKKRYEAKTVNYIGHSAGAMMGATLTGVQPNLIQNMISAGGRYDIHEESDNKDLISIIDVLDKVKDTKFLLIYGSADKISKPEVTINFYEQAKKKGLDVHLVKVEGAGHIDLDMTDTAVEAITELLEEE